MTDPRALSALAHRAPIDVAGVAALSERAFETIAILRGDEKTVRGPLQSALDLSRPARIGETTAAGALVAIQTSPDETILLAPEAGGAALLATLRAALGDSHHQLVDVSDHLATLTLAGPRARDLLSKLVTIDLHPRAFTAGAAVATLLGKAAVTLWLEAEDDAAATFRIVVRRSFADYAWRLLAEAGREWGLPEQPARGIVNLESGAPH